MKIGNRFRTRLRLLILTSILLAVLALALPLIYSSQQTVTTEKEQHRSVLVKLLAQEADIVFEKYQVRLEREAGKIAELAKTEPDRIPAFLQSIREDYPDFHNLYIWPLSEGEPVESTNMEAWIGDVSQRAITSEKVQFFSRGNNLFLAAPVGNGQALTAYINSKGSELQNRLQQIIEGETGRVFLLDTNGNYLFHSDPSLIGTYITDTAMNTDVDAITSASYSHYTLQKDGRELDFYFVPVPHWQMVAGFSISHNEETALLRGLWITGLSLSVLVIFFSIYYSGRISHNMTDSVDRLTTQIDRYSRGLKQDAFSYHDKAPEEINLMVNTLNQMQTQIKTGYLSLISSLSLALEARDSQTQGHSLRVARFGYLLACQMDLSSQLKQEVWEASLLHDIGKLSVSDSILHKPGSLSDSEFAQIKTHPQVGAKVVAHIPELGHLVPLIESHHEHYDGKGYPSGKSGTEIPLAARIMAVADAFEAMTTDRPYRKALSRSEALYRLEKGSGTQFDPEVVSAALIVFPQLPEGKCKFSPQCRWRDFTFTNLPRASREICILCYRFNPTCPCGQKNSEKNRMAT